MRVGIRRDLSPLGVIEITSGNIPDSRPSQRARRTGHPSPLMSGTLAASIRGEDCMHFLGVNLWAVLVCALATMVVGFPWYSPVLFANPWMVLMGYDPNDKAKIAEMQKSAGPAYAMSTV